MGGAESVNQKRIDELRVGDLTLPGFRVTLGAMLYGFPIDALVGLDFLRAAGAIVDLARLELRRA